MTTRASMPMLLAVVALALAAWPAGADAQGQARPLYAPGELIIKFRESAAPSAQTAVQSTYGLALTRQLGREGVFEAAVPRRRNIPGLVRALRRSSAVEYAEPNYYRYIDAVPNDPDFGQMWGLNNTGQTGGTADADIDAPEAWDITTGSSDVVVAVIDSGMDMDHEDLAANLYVNSGEDPGNGVDDDGNGFIDDVSGWDFVGDDNDPNDPAPFCASHGTHTAGTVGAVGNNGVGVTGVAQTVRIMPLRAFRQLLIFCLASDADLIAAINYAAMMKVPISNNSYGGGPFSLAVYRTIAASRHLFVTAAGNNGRNTDVTPSFPASYKLPNIVAVAMSNDDDNLALQSNYGPTSVDLAAPGAGILSTVRNNGYGTLSGTSMASPHVAGAAALLLAQDPSATTRELAVRLFRGVDALGLPVATGGRLNAFNSLSLPPSLVTVTLTPNGPTSIAPGDMISFEATFENTTGAQQTAYRLLRIWLPSGKRLPLGSVGAVNLAPNGMVTLPISFSTKATTPPGEYYIIGLVTNGGAGTIFDEDQVIYEIN